MIDNGYYKRIAYILNRLTEDKKVSVTLAELNDIIKRGYQPIILDLYQSDRLSIYKIRLHR